MQDGKLPRAKSQGKMHVLVLVIDLIQNGYSLFEKGTMYLYCWTVSLLCEGNNTMYVINS